MGAHKIAVLIAPFRNRTKEDERDLYDAKLQLLLRGWLPIFLPDTLDGVLKDEDERERRVALDVSGFFCRVMAEVPVVEAVVVGKIMSEGMRSDVTAWLDAGGPAPMNFDELVATERATEEDGDGRDD